jgi:hypothetical protein
MGSAQSGGCSDNTCFDDGCGPEGCERSGIDFGSIHSSSRGVPPPIGGRRSFGPLGPIYMKEPSGTGVFADVCSHIRAKDAAGLQAYLSHDKLAVLETDADGNTALHYAAVRGNVEAAAVLLRHGVDPDATNAGGKTAIDLAAAVPDTAMVRCIIAKKRKYSGRAQSLQKKQMRRSSAKDGEDEDEVLVIRPTIRAEEWDSHYAKEQKQLREAFYRHGQKPPREEMAARVNNIDQNVRVASLCKQAEYAAERKAQDIEALQNVSL